MLSYHAPVVALFLFLCRVAVTQAVTLSLKLQGNELYAPGNGGFEDVVSCIEQPLHVILELKDVGALLIGALGLVAVTSATICVVVVQFVVDPRRVQEHKAQPPCADATMKQEEGMDYYHSLSMRSKALIDVISKGMEEQIPPPTALAPRVRTADPPFIGLVPGVKLQNRRQRLLFSTYSQTSMSRDDSSWLYESFVRRFPNFLNEEEEEVPASDLPKKIDSKPLVLAPVSPFEDPSNWPQDDVHFTLCCNPAGPQLVYNINVEPVYNGLTKEGGCGVVREGTYTDTMDRVQRVVLKSLRPCAPHTALRALKNEIMILGSLPPHPNVVRPFGFSLGRSPYIALEFMSITLQDLLKRDTKDANKLSMLCKDGLTYREIINITVGVVSGLEHLHHHDIVHNDIKEGNIMLDENLNPKIIDFGSAKQKSGGGAVKGGQGTLGYIAPQREYGLEDRDDVYSLGTVMWNCITAGCDQPTLAERLKVHVGNSCRCGGQSNLPKQLTQLIHECWRFERGKRPRLADIKDHLRRMESQPWAERRPARDLAWAVASS